LVQIIGTKHSYDKAFKEKLLIMPIEHLAKRIKAKYKGLQITKGLLSK
jgi:hypothetical protein